MNASAIHQLISKQSVLASHVEGYSVTATQLTLLINEEIPEKEFISQVLFVMKERVETGVAKRGTVFSDFTQRCNPGICSSEM